MSATDLREWLPGDWAVERTFNEHDRFEGTATFSPLAEGGLRWREHGEVALGDHRGPASRELTLEPAGAAGTWQVLFDDGRPFHPLDLSDGRCSVRHDCGDDVYLGEYAVSGPGTLTVTWEVSGPGRQDTIRSVYVRRPTA